MEIAKTREFLTSALAHARRDLLHGTTSSRSIFVVRAVTWPIRLVLRKSRQIYYRAGKRPAEAPIGVITPSELGLRDAAVGGWFIRETGELFRGFSIRADDVVVDVGCGDGGNARFCASLGARTTIVDISSAALQRTQERLKWEPGIVTAIESDGDPLPITGEFATRVICTEVLEHVDDPARFLAELVRIGKRGAVYLLSVPDPVGEEVQKHIAPKSSFMKPNHIRIIQREEFADMITAAGLIIESRAYHGFFWTMWWTFVWPLKVDLADTRHPVLDGWLNTWNAVLNAPGGIKIKELLDEVMPKSQIVIARKP